MLQELLPTIKWKSPWHFKSLPTDYWTIPENQLQFFNEMEDILGVKKKEDWYAVKLVDVIEKGGSELLNK